MAMTMTIPPKEIQRKMLEEHIAGIEAKINEHHVELGRLIGAKIELNEMLEKLNDKPPRRGAIIWGKSLVPEKPVIEFREIT